ncbi:MAG: GNAT family N-acetyltransferase [Casimicrobiaceae bacterium]|nr:GNAT family N-acetyltransferase [Casimicrobiaceae bacterium]MDW8311498.1 N-acetyltransferase family protein [Burkholderiales bacterium]
MLIRDARETDLSAVRAIYAHWVERGSGTFELEAPTEEEMARRYAEVRSRGLPWLVAERDGAILGYAYGNWFRPRPAYRFAIEDSIYVAPEAQRMGVARALLAELIVRCETRGARQMIAVIGDSENHASIALHRALGFRHMGTLVSVGWKFGRWLDAVLMQRPLGIGASEPAFEDKLSRG